MKTKHPFISQVLLLLVLIFTLALANFNQPAVLAQPAGAAFSLQQEITPTPAEPNAGEIGSTDGILLMGIVISLIVTLPLLFRKKGR